MKKIIAIVLIGILIVSCKVLYTRDYTYTLKETVEPQTVVDSILGFHSKYTKWPSMKIMGVYRSDSTQISAYLNSFQVSDTLMLHLSVVEYGNCDTAVVKSKPTKL